MKFDFEQFVKQVFQTGLAGKSVDQLIKVLSPNLDETATDLRIELNDPADFKKMIKDADDTFIVIDQGPPLCALYLPDEYCPVSRIYFIRPKSLNEAFEFLEYLNGSGFQATQQLDDEDALMNKIMARGAAERIANYKKRNYSPIHEKAEKLGQGRNENTVVEQTEYFQTDGCFICGSKPVRLMSSTIALDTAHTIQLLLCELHSSEALADDSILNYIARRVGLQPPIAVTPLDLKNDKNYLLEAENIVRNDMECDIEKISREDRTITATRKRSGLRVIIRLQSEVKPGYAYMLNIPEGPQVSRIDEAPDHPDVDFYPDHRHTGLPKNNREAVPSFTTGHIRLDLPAILAEISRIEESL